ENQSNRKHLRSRSIGAWQWPPGVPVPAAGRAIGPDSCCCPGEGRRESGHRTRLIPLLREDSMALASMRISRGCAGLMSISRKRVEEGGDVPAGWISPRMGWGWVHGETIRVSVVPDVTSMGRSGPPCPAGQYAAGIAFKTWVDAFRFLASAALTGVWSWLPSTDG